MTRRPLQPTRFDQSAYDRPNCPWVCGHAAEGSPCRQGPDARGECGTRADCVPRRDGDRWQCTRPASHGGPCAGPGARGECAHPIVPCTPVRSPGARRGRAARRVFALALAAAGLALADPAARRAAVDPGPLSRAHAGRVACAGCHVSDASMRAGLAAGAAGNSEKCLDCHPIRVARSPHGLDVGPGPIAALIECAACHREHRGAEAVVALERGDARCHTCHAVKFGSFREGHPEFDGYGEAVGRLAFRHAGASHRAWPCASCHAPAAGGGEIRVLPFERSCAPCHAEGLEGRDGLALLGVDGATPLERLVAKAVPAATLAGLTLESRHALADRLMPDDRDGSRTLACGLPATGAAGGPWSREGALLRYRPSGHGDPFLRGVHDLAAREAASADGRRLLVALQRDGRCTECHPADRESRIVAWTPGPAAPAPLARLTLFSHGPHGMLGCVSCHVASGSLVDAPDFGAIPKSLCAGCHVEGQAGESCRTCHHYHADPPAQPAALPIALAEVGADLCAHCHAAEAKSWLASSHVSRRRTAEDAATYPPELRDTCGSCHAIALPENAQPGQPTGARCESCHGPAGGWVAVHGDAAVPDRRARAERAGMATPRRVHDLAVACLGCHLVADERLVAAGHPLGSDFELLAWSQGEVLHRFLDRCGGGGDSNRAAPVGRRRVLYAVGRLADLEATLDAFSQSSPGSRFRRDLRRRLRFAADEVSRLSAAAEIGADLDPVLAAVTALGLKDAKVDPDPAAVRIARDAAAVAARRIEARPEADLAALDPLLSAAAPVGKPWSP